MTTATSWDLLFAVPDGAAFHPAGTSIMPRPGRVPDGWTGPTGPGLAWRNWPRSTNTGMPMMHVLTLCLPDEYRRQGLAYVGISFFAGEGALALDHPSVAGDTQSSDPFLADLGDAAEHPGLRKCRDNRGNEFALVWLTAAELGAAATPCMPDIRLPATHVDVSDGLNCWDNVDEEHRDVWLVPRPDPNSGLTPRDDPFVIDGSTDVDGYTWTARADGTSKAWAEALRSRSHLGGTAFPLQEVPSGLTPRYLELVEIASGTFGCRSIYIDLGSDVIEWQAD